VTLPCPKVSQHVMLASSYDKRSRAFAHLASRKRYFAGAVCADPYALF
jgi:hypothetical protein